jgi:tripartite ATP-independent transporter DctM subunit
MIAANIVLIGVFLALLALGAPIAVSLGLAGFAAIAVGLDPAALQSVGQITYNSIAKYPLIAIPLFVLTGVVFERSGVAGQLITFMQAIVGPRRGGLALVAILVCMILGGMSGSGPADAAAVATIMIPSMRRAGYPDAFSASVIAAGASTAILIPPSLALVIYGVLVPGVDLRALFAAGLVPGVLVGLAVMAPAWWLSRRHGFGFGEGTQRPPFWRSLANAVPGLAAPVIILGGLRSGVFTPTEAASVAAVYGLLVGLAYRAFDLRAIFEIFAEAAETTAVIMIIIALAGLFAFAGSTLGAFDHAAKSILALTSNSTVILLLVMIVVLFLGMILDGASIYLISLPLLYPIAVALGWNLTWFGVLMAVNIAIGQVTPPVAVNLFVTTKVANVSIEATVVWVLWFVLAMGVVLLALIAFPELSLWLPRYLEYSV